MPIAERKRELRLEAARQARLSPLFFDLTLSLSKSISIFHASLGENARLARQAGDEGGYEYWSGLVAEVDSMIWQAVRAGFEYFQREAGYTRTGSHSKRVNGQETGQWREADLVVAHWLQHTSRDGDMQLHVHSQIAHVARTAVDGKWRAPDSLGYNEHIGAVGGRRILDVVSSARSLMRVRAIFRFCRHCAIFPACSGRTGGTSGPRIPQPAECGTQPGI